MSLFGPKKLPPPVQRYVEGLGGGFYTVLLFARGNAAGHARDFVRFNFERHTSLVDATPTVPGVWDVVVLPDSGMYPSLGEVLDMSESSWTFAARDPLSDRAILVMGELSKADWKKVVDLAKSSTYAEFVRVLDRGKRAGPPTSELDEVPSVQLREPDRSDKPDRAALVRRLGDSRLSSSERIQAAETLGQLGDEVPVEAFLDALRFPLSDVRYPAIEVLGKYGAVESLIEALSHEDVEVSTAAVQALARRRDTRAVDPLIAAVGHHREPVRVCAIAALGDLGDPRAVESLILALGDGSHNVREVAVANLGRLGDPRAVESLIVALGDGSHNVRQAAAAALRRLGGPEAERALAEYEKLPRSRLP